MPTKTPRRRTKPEHKPSTLDEWVLAAQPSFSQEDLLTALDDMTRDTAATDLSGPDRAFWTANSGIDSSRSAVVAASAANASARLLHDAGALTANEVAENLHLSPSTVRHYKAARKLYSYPVDGKLAFPVWQFNDEGDRVIPSLEIVLVALPADLHPQSVAGFFLTPQPDLVVVDTPVSAKDWLVMGGPADPVVDLAEDLADGY